MTSIRKIAMTFGMAMFAGVLMAQSADQNANAAANADAAHKLRHHSGARQIRLAKRNICARSSA